MQLPEEPKRPEPSREVQAWFNEREMSDRFISLADFKAKHGRDLPPHVLAYVDAHDAWMTAHEEFRKKLPIDYDPRLGSMGRVRFLGGDWIDAGLLWSTVFTAQWDNTMHTVVLHDAVNAAFARMGEDEFRAFVAGVYEHLRMRAAAEVALVKHLLTGAAR